MSNIEQDFEVVLDKSKELVKVLSEDSEAISSVDRARLRFELRLAYNLSASLCENMRLTQELQELITECELLLVS
ncbi:MAG: hypothetical protein C4575_00755 [Desulforudis sp.]|nr:hypothetical protein [Clostridia bacterium]MDQ7790779.1 hypothetical protein [Clostridia bacterium]RJX22637.1 MAG: hypothetical protein C4575_00755 [Desulforudis sp.]